MSGLRTIRKIKQKMAEIGYLSLRDSARELKVSPPAVLYWLRKNGEEIIPMTVNGVTIHFISSATRNKLSRIIRRRRQ